MEFIEIEEALNIIRARVQPLSTERVPLDRALGRIIATSIVATIDAPPFDNSAMDGVTFRFRDLGADPLTVAGVIAAGDAPIEAKPGVAYRIMTGAPVPTGCDTVAMREHVTESDGAIVIEPTPVAGSHIRKQGSYVRNGDAVMEQGHLIDAGAISMLATFGFVEVEVFRRPRVAVVTTGDELVPISEEPSLGKIRNSNAWMLEALCQGAGVEVDRLPIVGDDRDAIRQTFDDAIATHDVVISVGGVSVGDFDFVRDTIEVVSDDVSFWKVKMKPGKPLTHGVANGVHLLGLPGNPMSCFVSFHIFAAALFGWLTGRPELQRIATYRNAQTLRSTPKRTEYVTGRIVNGSFERIGDQSSGNLAAMFRCDALAVIGEGTSEVLRDEPITVVDLRT